MCIPQYGIGIELFNISVEGINDIISWNRAHEGGRGRGFFKRSTTIVFKHLLRLEIDYFKSYIIAKESIDTVSWKIKGID